MVKLPYLCIKMATMKVTTTTMVIAIKETIAGTDAMTADTVDTATGEMTATTVMETIMTGITPMATIATGDMTEITTTTMATGTNKSVFCGLIA